MKSIRIYDTEAELINEICEENDLTEAAVIELLADYINEMKLDNGLK